MRDAELRHGFSDPSDEQRYLDALNICFDGWGGREMFDWCFRRRCADRLPDVLSLWVAGHQVAGSAISYRRIALPGGATVTAGIMTASWTLPEARGTGAFQQLIRASVEQVAASGGALLLAFVTATNASRRRLQSEGAELMPTYYCRADTAGSPQGLDICEMADAAGVTSEFQRDRPETRFVYSADEWTGQFVNRPGQLCALDGSGRWQALVERAGAFDRVHAVSAREGEWPGAMAALAARAAAAGRRAFAFTTSAVEAGALREHGFVMVDGFLTALPVNPDALAHALGIRRDGSSPRGMLTDPRSPWFLGPWTLQNGDRI